jgi:hypothetical protein
VLTQDQANRFIEPYKSKDRLMELARFHWKKARPSLWKSLQERGELEKMLKEAVDQTWERMEVIKAGQMEKGWTLDQAMSVAWEFSQDLILIPTERELKQRKRESS